MAQATRWDPEAFPGDVVTIFHIAFLNLVAADVGAVPINCCNLLTTSIQVNVEGTLCAGGRAFSTTVTPLVLLVAFDPGPLGAHGLFESII